MMKFRAKTKHWKNLYFLRMEKKVFFHEKINEFDYVNLNFAYF